MKIYYLICLYNFKIIVNIIFTKAREETFIASTTLY